MHMFYKSPGRALRDLRGINTGPLQTSWAIIRDLVHITGPL